MRASDLYAISNRAAGCLIHARDTNKWLFLLRSASVDNPGTWALPGGHVEVNEDYLAGAIREAREEAGVDLTEAQHKLIHVHRTDWPLSIYATYAFCIEAEFKPQLNWESQAYVWCSLDELPTPLHWGVDAMLNNSKAAERLHAWLQSIA